MVIRWGKWKEKIYDNLWNVERIQKQDEIIKHTSEDQKNIAEIV